MRGEDWGQQSFLSSDASLRPPPSTPSASSSLSLSPTQTVTSGLTPTATPSQRPSPGYTASGSPKAAPADSSTSSQLPAGKLAAIVVGSVVGAAVIGAGGWLLWQWQSRVARDAGVASSPLLGKPGGGV